MPMLPHVTAQARHERRAPLRRSILQKVRDELPRHVRSMSYDMLELALELTEKSSEIERHERILLYFLRSPKPWAKEIGMVMNGKSPPRRAHPTAHPIELFRLYP